ncbi:unnamed protein product [Rhizoctonia solani]|uniref:Laminin domain protein n=1 Tax=Rhizoctonia solani TaxID=456999 RepID=A0A8H3I4A3_9AGAM|nr:unnamed protein product [Rhizoctonia solani]
MFDLKPILANPSHEEVKVVHEAVRALNNFLHTPELRDTDLSIELSQHLFDVQMACHRHKYPNSILPNDVVYDPPTLPAYIPVNLNPVIGPPSNKEVASVHTALRISESFANFPSIFDPDLHVQLSQHLFDIQLARHVQRSIAKRSPPHNETVSYVNPDVISANSSSRNTSPDSTPDQGIESTEAPHLPSERSSSSNKTTIQQHPNERNETHRTTELMIDIRDRLDNVSRILVGTQNSLARGFNSSSYHRHYSSKSICYDLGAHSLINDHGEVPETHNLPTFTYSVEQYDGSPSTQFTTNNLPENELARYLRFYSIGEEMVEEGEELKIKSGMVDSARDTLSRRLFLDRR